MAHGLPSGGELSKGEDREAGLHLDVADHPELAVKPPPEGPGCEMRRIGRVGIVVAALQPSLRHGPATKALV